VRAIPIYVGLAETLTHIRGWLVIIIDLLLLLLVLAAILTKYQVIRLPLPSLPPIELAYLAGAAWLLRK
jgi:hypothetical protein